MITNILIIDDGRTYTGNDLNYSLVEKLNFLIVTDKNADNFWYVKNRLTGITDKKFPLDHLKAHLTLIEDMGF